MIAALYIDPRGPYPSIPGVECWDAERDARNYAGPWPVVAHPPCGPWSKLKGMCWKQDRSLAPIAVGQVRRWGGRSRAPQRVGVILGIDRVGVTCTRWVAGRLRRVHDRGGSIPMGP